MKEKEVRHELPKFKAFMIALAILLTISLVVKFVIPQLANKEDTCEQIAFKAKKFSLITNHMYFSQKLQKACIKQWDAKDNSDWRSCVLDSESRQELSKCTPPPYIYIALRNGK